MREREGGRHLMGFDARQSYERVTAKEILHTDRIFALITNKPHTGILCKEADYPTTTCFPLSYSSKLHYSSKNKVIQSNR